jgi:hypothetical protein
MSNQVRDLLDDDGDDGSRIFDDDDDDVELDIFDDEDERERTPIGGTPIVLNPKVDGDATALSCPDCGEEIAAETFKDGAIVEYRCGCDELKKFKIAGADR